MATVAAPRSQRESFDLVQWARGMVAYAVGLMLVALSLGGVLYYAWDPLAAMFTFTHPISGYWTCVLVVLGAYGAFRVYDAARDGTVVDADSVGSILNGVSRLGVLLVLAWVVSEYLV